MQLPLLSLYWRCQCDTGSCRKRPVQLPDAVSLVLRVGVCVSESTPLCVRVIVCLLQTSVSCPHTVLSAPAWFWLCGASMQKY
jgi:hypothetical protein